MRPKNTLDGCFYADDNQNEWGGQNGFGAMSEATFHCPMCQSERTTLTAPGQWTCLDCEARYTLDPFVAGAGAEDGHHDATRGQRFIACERAGRWVYLSVTDGPPAGPA